MLAAELYPPTAVVEDVVFAVAPDLAANLEEVEDISLIGARGGETVQALIRHPRKQREKLA